jgi:hypothetical protein
MIVPVEVLKCVLGSSRNSFKEERALEMRCAENGEE